MDRRAATHVDRILKGVEPTDLPVEQPTKFQFVIIRKTTKTLGLTIPPACSRSQMRSFGSDSGQPVQWCIILLSHVAPPVTCSSS
jgi:ABC-type uncharacterized transport system substrate-binding protein